MKKIMFCFLILIMSLFYTSCVKEGEDVINLPDRAEDVPAQYNAEDFIYETTTLVCHYKVKVIYASPLDLTNWGKTERSRYVYYYEDGSKCYGDFMFDYPELSYDDICNAYIEEYQQSYTPTLRYKSFGDGTCEICGIDNYESTWVRIPRKSPYGDKVVAIGRYAFAGCKNLIGVILPNTCTTIKTYAFKGCSSLKVLAVSEEISFSSLSPSSTKLELSHFYIDGNKVPDAISHYADSHPEIEIITRANLEHEEPSEESSKEESKEQSKEESKPVTPKTGYNGMIALAVVSVIALAGVAVVKNK